MSKNDVTVELFYNGVWNDITLLEEVFTESPITIIQGVVDENSGFRPCSISMRLNNTNDKYRITNPQSPLYRLVGRNTQIRVQVGGNVRGVAEVNSWKCDQTQDFRKDPRRGKAWCDISATGIMGRVNRWNKLIRSPLFRAITLADPTTYTAAEYWDMESPSGSSTSPSAVGGSPLIPVSEVRYTLPDGSNVPPGGAPDFGRGDGIPGSASLPNFQNGGTLSAPVRSATFDGYAIDWVMQFEATSDVAANADVLNWSESGTYVDFTVNVTKGFVTVFHANAADHATLASTGSATAALDVFDGAPHHYRYQVRQNGGNYLAELRIDSALYATADNFVPPMAGTVGSPRTIQWNPLEDSGVFLPSAAGHLAIWISGQIGGQPPTFYATYGYSGDTVADRFDRIFDEENITHAIIGTTSKSHRMGPQKPDTLFNITKEMRDTEDGLIYDDNDTLTVIFKLLNFRYNQTALTLYPTDFPGLPMEITDGVDTHNIITVSQRDGGEITVRDDSGFLGTQDPPDGVGEEKDQVDVNLYRPDYALPFHANWWLRRGTVDLPRYPQVVIDLNASPGLVAAVNAMLLGSVIEIVTMRENTIRQYVLGWTEVIGTHGRTITFTCKPDQQFDIALQDNTNKRQESYTSTLNASYGVGDTSLVVRFTVLSDQWSQDNEPYDWDIEGERITVTSMSAVSGSGPYTQTATVTRGINGIFKPHTGNSSGTGTPVHMFPEQQARQAL